MSEEEKQADPAPAKQFNQANVYALPEPEVGIDTRTFKINGEDWVLTIETNGSAIAEKFAKLKAAQSYALQQTVLMPKGKTWEERFSNPGGKEIIITDHAYMGALKTLHEVLLPKDAMPFESLVVFCHRAGSDTFEEITKWAEDLNGISDYAMRKFLEISKNLRGGADLSDESAPPV